MKNFDKKIHEALKKASRKISMNSDEAKKIMKKCAVLGGMSATVVFIPVANAAITSAGTSLGLTAFLSATTIALGTSSVLMVMPNAVIKKVTVEKELRRLESEVIVVVDNSDEISEVYASSENEKKWYKGSLEDRNIFTISVDENGGYKLIVVCKDGREIYDTFSVNNIDNIGPRIANYFVEEGYISFSFDASGADINMNSLYAINEAGNIYKPLTIDSNIGYAQFEYYQENLEIHIEDNLGNQAIYKVTPKEEY
ncbi:hypothetical protein [Anaerorhabdus sp.]|uniref:hypothetical protein n=1 Tax=Anaerorhabdus sp. TaxID=1872524 RepID=UPI002B1FC647|nr:hypothetical protein [Anaerorhabdus sp.]MEA4874510.1 hypothetical protein [Anaerorhabdus sp.]